MFSGYLGANRSFSRRLRCYSVSLAPTQQQADTVEYGGKIFLPPSALEELSMLNVSYPMLFKVTNERDNRHTHCGVLEFNAKEGQCHLPYWMMQMLLITEGDIITITDASLALGNFVKVQPQTTDFLDVSNPRAVLEHELAKFSCLTVGDIIAIKYNKKIYELKIVDARPGNAICIVETDVEVDFAPPPGYVEPQRPPSAQGVPFGTSPNQQLLQQAAASAVDDQITGFVAFRGQGNRIKDRGSDSATIPIQSNLMSASGTNLSSGGSSAMLSSSVGASAGSFMSSSPQNPNRPFGSYSPSNAAPLNLPKGKLVFAPANAASAPPPPPSTTVVRSTGVPQQTTSGFKPFSGQGHSLK